MKLKYKPCFFGVFLFLFFCAHLCNAQDIIKGYVKNIKSEPLINANIVAFEDSTLLNALAFNISDEEGFFSLKIPKPILFVYLKVSYFGFSPITQKISLPVKKSLEFMLEETSIELKEVIVTTDVLRDTMNIKTQNLNLTPSSSLRDILNKTEGFIVTKEGGISYQGIPITKVLINKKEVFINQNKIALDNLNFDMMEKLQLINNYKDNFKVDFDNFTTSVINIKTKKEFKGVLKEKIDGAVGIKNSYELKAKGMFFSDAFNAFLIHNTNNIGEKELSFEDISESSIQKSSGFFKNNFSNFFVEDELLQKNFNSNTSLTVRKQGDNNKMGVVGYLNFLEATKLNQNTTQILATNTTAKKELNNLSDLGKFGSLKYYFSTKLHKRTVLDYVFEVGTVHKQNQDINNINNYNTVAANIIENNETAAFSTHIHNALNMSSLLSSKMIFTATLSYSTEKSNNSFESSFFTPNATNGKIAQNFDLTQTQINPELGLRYKFSNLFTLELGSKYAFFNQSSIIKNRQSIQRNGTNGNIYLSGSGKTKALDYYFVIGNDNYWFALNDFKANTIAKINTSINYKINSSNSLNVTYNQYNSLFDLYKNLDTLAVSFNNRVLGNNDYNFRVTNTKKATLGYYYSNVAKSQSFNIIGNYEIKNNYLEPIFDKVERNVFYYKNYLIDEKKNIGLNIGARKSFYFGERLHRIEFSVNSSTKSSRYPTYSDNTARQFNLDGQLYSFQIGFEPKSFFLTQIDISYITNTQKIYIDSEFLNQFSSQIYTIDLIANHEKFEGKIALSQRVNNSLASSFSIPLMDIKATYKLNDTVSLFLKGKSLFNLFNIYKDNFSAINQFSDGIVLNQNINFYRINYLILGVSLHL